MDIVIDDKLLRQAFVKFIDRADGAVVAALKEIEVFLEGRLKADIHDQAFVRGSFLRSVFAEPRGVVGNRELILSSSHKAAGAIEYGREPGKMPPVEPLVLWAKRKFGVDDDEAVSIAWGTAKMIKKFGTMRHQTKKPGPFANTYTKYKAMPQVIFDRHMADLIASL